MRMPFSFDVFATFEAFFSFMIVSLDDAGEPAGGNTLRATIGSWNSQWTQEPIASTHGFRIPAASAKGHLDAARRRLPSMSTGSPQRAHGASSERSRRTRTNDG
jgi:hypothetical protein